MEFLIRKDISSIFLLQLKIYGQDNFLKNPCKPTEFFLKFF